jgi:hypothetical protein
MAPGDVTTNSQPSETSPLLVPRNEDTGPANGTIEGQNADGEENGVPIANPPSSAKLWVILLNTWVGVFLGALGTPSRYFALRGHAHTV